MLQAFWGEQQAVVTLVTAACNFFSMKSYGKAYFDKWYRDPRHRVSTAASTGRKVRMALAVAEYYLERPVRSVLDVGCGEGQWQPVLKRLRPALRYTGIDPSPYAVRRFGARRNLRLGSFGNLPELEKCYDLLVCSDCLYYVADEELIPGLAVLVQRLNGIAFLEAYPSDAALDGDTRGMTRRDPGAFRRIFRHVGLVSCGSHCYAPPPLHGQITAMERGSF